MPIPGRTCLYERCDLNHPPCENCGLLWEADERAQAYVEQREIDVGKRQLMMDDIDELRHMMVESDLRGG